MASTLPPPPPPPPPPMEQHPPSTPQPTFLQQWLENETTKTATGPRKTKREQVEYLSKQCMFPRYIPQSVMCNVDPILHLIAHHDVDGKESGNGDSGSGGIVVVGNNETLSNNVNLLGEEKQQSTKTTTTTTTNNNGNSEIKNTILERRTALDDVREIVSRCATYKSRSVSNRDEFNYKRAIMKEKKRQQQQQQQQRQEQSTQNTANTNTNPSNDETSQSNNTPTTLPSKKPPYHPEYTPLSLSENFLLAKIHGANYNLCLASAVCPDRTRRLMKCWNGLDPQWVRMMEEHEMEGYVCLEEREAVERCVGLGVQRVMKDVLG